MKLCGFLVLLSCGVDSGCAIRLYGLVMHGLIHCEVTYDMLALVWVRLGIMKDVNWLYQEVAFAWL